jgi:hypothetical protein
VGLPASRLPVLALSGGPRNLNSLPASWLKLLFSSGLNSCPLQLPQILHLMAPTPCPALLCAVNVVGGLQLHADVLTPAEQQLVVDTVEHWVELVSRRRCFRGCLCGEQIFCRLLHAAGCHAPLLPLTCYLPPPLISCCLLLQGRAGRMRGRTFSAPKKWLPGKGRMTMQFGCCYNYATDSQGRPPGAAPPPELVVGGAWAS